MHEEFRNRRLIPPPLHPSSAEDANVSADGVKRKLPESNLLVQPGFERWRFTESTQPVKSHRLNYEVSNVLVLGVRLFRLVRSPM